MYHFSARKFRVAASIFFCLAILLLVSVKSHAKRYFTDVAAGGYHSLALKSDGSVWACGFNKYGQVGDGSSMNNRLIPKQVAEGFVAIAVGNGFPWHDRGPSKYHPTRAWRVSCSTTAGLRVTTGLGA